ncbi:MAG: aminoacyl-tRNA deacylase, partial [Planctomycetota bacterium]
QIDLTALGQAIGATYVTLATEEEIRQRFPDCEVGAMPPFGNLYDLPVVVDAPLSMDKEIVFEAGNHHEAIKLAYTDFERLVHPQVAEIGIR